jgi:hypothetical protein
MPRIYEVIAVIEPGIAGVRDDGDTIENISGKIIGGVYNRPM